MSTQPANLVNLQDQAYVANFPPEHMAPGFSHTTFMQPTVTPNTFIAQSLPVHQPTYITQVPFQTQPFVNPTLVPNQILSNPVQQSAYPWISIGQLAPQFTTQLAPHYTTNTLFVPASGTSLAPPQQPTFTNTSFSDSPNQLFLPGYSSTNAGSTGSRLGYSSSEGNSTKSCASTIVTTPGLSVGRSRTPEFPESLKRQYEQATTYAGRGRGRTFVSTPPSQQKGAPQRKYPHRSKQRKIENTTRWIQTIAENLGIFAAPRELVRGRRTVQCHAKTFQACKDVKIALQKILENEIIQIARIACPFSKKNEFQKKGFILYLKVEDETQVRLAEEIFRKQGLKIRRAVSKAERLEIEAENASIAMMEQQSESAPQTGESKDCCGVLGERKTSSIDETNRGMMQSNQERVNPEKKRIANDKSKMI